MSKRTPPKRTAAPKATVSKDPDKRTVAESAAGAATAIVRPGGTKPAERTPNTKSVFVPARSQSSASSPAKAPETASADATGSTTVASGMVAVPAVEGLPSKTRPATRDEGQGEAPQSLASSAKAVDPAARGSQGSTVEVPGPVSLPEEVEHTPEPESPPPADTDSQATTVAPPLATEPSGSAAATPTASVAAAPTATAPVPDETGRGSRAVSAAADPGFTAPWNVGGAALLDSSAASLGEINEAVLIFVRGESEAALAHVQALAQVRSASDLIRLQFGAFQRSADASLTCLSSIVRSASRFGSVHRR